MRNKIKDNGKRVIVTNFSDFVSLKMRLIFDEHIGLKENKEKRIRKRKENKENICFV